MAESWKKKMAEGKPETTKQDGNKASLVQQGRDLGSSARFAVGSFSVLQYLCWNALIGSILQKKLHNL